MDLILQRFLPQEWRIGESHGTSSGNADCTSTRSEKERKILSLEEGVWRDRDMVGGLSYRPFFGSRYNTDSDI